jgi:hypothetical protein
MFGGAWYTLLSKPWLGALGAAAAQTKAVNVTQAMIITVIAELVMAWTLAGLIGHMGAVTVRSGVISALFVWLGFFVAPLVVTHAYQGQKPMLTVIDAGHWLGVLLVQGAVIGMMGVR